MEPTPNESDLRSKNILLAIAVVFACVWLATLGDRKLSNPDEGRYAEIPREMLASGDFTTPRLNDLKYFEKPPLQYWGTAVAYQMFGMNEFAARFWCGLTGLAGVFAVAFFGRRLFGATEGIIAAGVLASFVLYGVLGHLNTLDMGLSFFLQLAIGGFLLAQRSEVGSSTERNWMLVAWASTALAVLSKGIVALALPVLTLVVYTAVQREFSAWKRLHILFGTLVFLAIGAPWFVLVSIKNPEFAEFFFLHEHFQRFLTDVADRVEPWWYFIPLLVVGALPWTSLAIAALPSAWRADSSTTVSFKSRRFLVVWIAATMVFFSISHSKLPPYIVPLFPALALLVGDYVGRLSKSVLVRHLLAMGVLWLIALGYTLFGPLPTRRDTPSEIFAEVFHWGSAGFALALIGTALACYFAARNRIRWAVISASMGAFLAVSLLSVDFAVMRRLRSGYDLAQSIAPAHDPSKPFYSVGAYDHSLSFYLQRPVTVVDYRGELIFGQQQEPTKSLPDLPAFIDAWGRAPSGALAVVIPDVYEYLRSQGLPMSEIGRDIHLIAVKKP